MLYEKLGFSCINGDTALWLRKGLIKRFNDGRCLGLTISVQCGKYGLNLSRASTAIYFSNTYNLDDRVQSEERILHTSKQDTPLLYIDLISANTIQADILKVLRKKHAKTQYFMGDILEETRKRNG